MPTDDTGVAGKITPCATGSTWSIEKAPEYKARVALLPARALLEVAKVMDFGNQDRNGEKRGPHGWRDRCGYLEQADKALSHLLRFLDGEDTDDESGLPALAHAAARVLMLLEASLTRPDLDDRYKE